MKKLFTTALTMLSSIICFAQRGGTERSYEVIGLADGDEIAESLKIAIPLLIVGFLIAYIFMWSKKDTSKTDDASKKYWLLWNNNYGSRCFFPSTFISVG